MSPPVKHVAMTPNEKVIEQTEKWITNVVVGCNFCPFAAREVKKKTIHYVVENDVEMRTCLEVFIKECIRLDNEPAIETTLIILPNAVEKFDDYLELVSLAESLLKKEGYEGIYQLASFHPEYRFAGAPAADAANYSNRSLYPMLHILREESIEKALEKYPNPEMIPENNINFARGKGRAYMKMLRDSCL